MKATAVRRCDFGLPTVTGKTTDEEFRPALELCGKLRMLTRLLKADAARCWSEKDTDAAVDRLVAMYGLCVHAGQTSIVLTALADASLIGLTNDTARTMAGGADGRSLTAEQNRRVRAAMDRLDAADPAGFVRARKAEGRVSDANTESRLEQGQSKLMQDMARTRQVLGPP